MHMGTRITERRKALGMSMQQLADLVGVSRATISNWENGIHGIESDKLPVLASHLRTTVAYLFNEGGVRELPGVAEPRTSYPDRRRVPLISNVQAGTWTNAADSYPVGYGAEMLDVDFEVADGTFGLVVEGDSMLPEFTDGDRIVVDPSIKPFPGDFVVAKNDKDEAMFKKYRPRGINEHGNAVFELVPLNPDYPTRYSDRENIDIIGVMVEHRRRRRR